MWICTCELSLKTGKKTLVCSLKTMDTAHICSQCCSARPWGHSPPRPMSPVLTGAVREGQWHSCSMPHSPRASHEQPDPQSPQPHVPLCACLKITVLWGFQHKLSSFLIFWSLVTFWQKAEPFKVFSPFCYPYMSCPAKYLYKVFFSRSCIFLLNAEMPRGKLKVGLILKLAVCDWLMKATWDVFT